MLEGDGLHINQLTLEHCCPDTNANTTASAKKTKRRGRRRNATSNTINLSHHADGSDTNNTSERLETASTNVVGVCVQPTQNWEDKVLGLLHLASVLGKEPLDMINGFADKLENNGMDVTAFRSAARKLLGV